MIEQGTEEWFAQRLGKVTASRVADVMAKTKSGYAAARKNYMMQLLCERLTGTREDGFTSAAMQRGTELEPFARIAYEDTTGVIVKECGFVDHPKIEMFGASPDGLVDDDGLIEIKCPNTAQHVAFIVSGKIESRYELQMRAQMACTGTDWCDFVSYDDRMPEDLQMVHTRITRDEAKETEMINEISIFLNDLDALEEKMRNEMKKRGK